LDLATIFMLSLLGWLLFLFLGGEALTQVTLFSRLTRGLTKDKTPSKEKIEKNLNLVLDYFISAEREIHKAYRGEPIRKIDAQAARHAIKNEALFFFSDWEKKQLASCFQKILRFMDSHPAHRYDDKDIDSLQKETEFSIRKIRQDLKEIRLYL